MKTMSRVLLFIAVPLLLGSQSWFCPPALADKVYLKNNEIMEGLVTRETENDVTLDFGFGQMTLDRKNIVKIEKCPFPAKSEEPAAAKKAAEKPQAKPATPAPKPAVKPAPPKPPQPKPPAAKASKTKEASVSEKPPTGETPPPTTSPAGGAGTTENK